MADSVIHLFLRFFHPLTHSTNQPIQSNPIQPLKRMVYAACAVLAIGEFSFVFMTSMNSVVFVCCITGIANGAYLTLDSR